MVESCYRCGRPAPNDMGTIYVRHRNDGGRWATDAICTSCWHLQQGARVPFRVRPDEPASAEPAEDGA